MLFRRLYVARTPMAMIWYAIYQAASFGPDWDRCSGLVVCDICGREYYDHPPHPLQAALHISCDGRLWHL
jgi:hypothetical protein